MNIVMKLVMVLILWSVSGVENSKSFPFGESFFMPEQRSRVDQKMDPLIDLMTKLKRPYSNYHSCSRNSQESSPRRITTKMPAPSRNEWLYDESLITTEMPAPPRNEWLSQKPLITTEMPAPPRILISSPRGEGFSMPEQKSQVNQIDQLIGVLMKLNKVVPSSRNSQESSPRMMTTEMPAPPRNEWLSHESLITDLNKVKNRDIFDPPFILGGYTFGFWRFYHTSPDNIVEIELCIYPYNRNNLKWPLSHDIRLSVLDARTRRFMIGTTFSRRTSWFRKSHYRKSSVRQYLWDSYVILNPRMTIKNWDYKSLIVITEMRADSSDSRG